MLPVGLFPSWHNGLVASNGSSAYSSIGERLVFPWYAQKNARWRGSPAEQPPKGGLALGSLLKQVSTCGGGSRKYSWLRSVFRPREAVRCSSSVWICGSVRHAFTGAALGHWAGGYGSVSSSAPPKVVWYRAIAPVRSWYWA